MTEHGPMSVGIVADDLTGANDSAVQFARRGWQARLTLGDPAAAVKQSGRAVTAVVTDARAHSAELARFETCAAVASFAASGIDRVFVKIDSTMRGTVSAQIAGALDAWQTVHAEPVAVVCPAYPAMGRTVDQGRVLVEGAGVHTTSVGRDPVTPVATDDLAGLVPGSITVGSGPSLAARIGSVAASGARIVTVDATTDADLREIGDAIAALGARAIPVGSAGLAVVMAEVWGGLGGVSSTVASDSDLPRTAGRVVIQVSSLHDASRHQHAHLVASEYSHRVRTLAPTLDEVSGADVAAAWIQRELASSDPLPDVVAVLAPDERGRGADASERVAAGLAAITDAVIAHSPAAALVLMGGEGARAVLSRVGADAIRVTDAIREGIPIGIVEGGRSHGLTVVTKAGGFGTESSLTEIVPELVGDAGPAASVSPLDSAPSSEPRRTP